MNKKQKDSSFLPPIYFFGGGGFERGVGGALLEVPIVCGGFSGSAKGDGV